MKKMDEKVAVEALKQVKEVLDKYKVNYWLDMGTLLGAIRDGKIIEWDSDIDLSVWYEDYSRIAAICLKLRAEGFDVLLNTHSEIAIKKEDCRITINFYHLSNNKAIKVFVIPKNLLGRLIQHLTHHLHFFLIISKYDEVDPKSRFLIKAFSKINLMMPYTLRRYFIKRMAESIILKLDKNIGSKYFISVVPSHYFNNFSKIKFYEMEFKTPTKTDEYLTYRYGKNWRVPKKNYIYYKEDGSICRQ